MTDAEYKRRDDRAEEWANAIAGMKMLRDGILMLPDDYPGKHKLLLAATEDKADVLAWYDHIKAEVLGQPAAPREGGSE